METSGNKKQTPHQRKRINMSGIRVSKKTRRDLNRLLDKVNKKQFGKKIKINQIIAISIKLICDEHIKELQQSSLTNADKIEMQYREYIRQNSSIPKDEFLGKLHKLMLGKMSQTKT